MKLERNASVCMKALPFWMLPYTFYMYYLSLFLMEKGLTSSQITLLMTVSNIASLVSSFIASPIVDRLGRKNTVLVFDLISSAVPAAILLVSQSFVPALIAMALNGLNRVMSTAYYLVLIEDTSDRNSLDSMNMFNIITVLSGVATPVAGIIVQKMGLIKGENLFLIVFLGQKRDADETVGFAILRSLLSDVGIGFLQLFGTLGIVLLLFEIRLLGGFDEESIVEIDDFSI
jgi:MFS family permease